MVLYGITLVPLAQDLRAADVFFLYLFYSDDVEFNGLARRSVQLLKIIMERGLDWEFTSQAGQVAFHC